MLVLLGIRITNQETQNTCEWKARGQSNSCSLERDSRIPSGTWGVTELIWKEIE
jgi:hypothetical protein